MYSLQPLKFLFEDNFGSNSTNSSCLEPNPILWVLTVFHECIYTTKEEVGFVLGLISIICWISASIPQLYENYKQGKADEALSFWFLLLWLFGDSTNLVGCVLTHQFPIQLYTAVYYVSMDILILCQFGYYFVKHRKQQNENRGIINDVLNSSSNRNQRILCLLCVGVIAPWYTINNGATSHNYNTGSHIGRMLLQTKNGMTWTPETISGYTIGCVSTLFYLGSRLPQILKNLKRQETEGISFIMFFLAVAGNTLYGSSILLQDPDPGRTRGEFLVFHLPWLIGSLGTLMLDFTILTQILYYGNHCCVRKIRPIGLLEEVDEDDNIINA